MTHQGGHKCDNNIGPGWYGFVGKAGTRMATSCTPQDRCKTIATGWLYGENPTVADGQVSRQVCFNFYDDCCWRSTNIQVRNCGSYYVYYLSAIPPSTCNARYCGTD